MRLPAGLEYTTRPWASSTVMTSDACSRRARSPCSVSRKPVSASPASASLSSGGLDSTSIGRVYGGLVHRSGCGNLFAPFQDGGIGPEPFKVVVAPDLVEEYVDDEVAVVEQHPLGVGEALDADGRWPVDRLYLSLDLLGDGLDLPAVVPAGDHEGVGDRQHTADVEDDSVLRLLGRGGPGRRGHPVSDGVQGCSLAIH